jgi:Family of unknown function (DUF5995)
VGRRPSTIVPSSRANTIAEVIERLRAIDGSLPADDGVAWFTKLYLRVTEAVEAQMAGAPRFRNPAFLARLDVVFANLYFDALRRQARDPATTPRAWAPLFEVRAAKGIAPIQFALAGMNAHINRDLPVALVTTAEELRRDLEDATPELADFRRLNALLEKTEHDVKVWFSTGFVGVVDSALGEVDDRIAMWDVARARDAAWVQAQTLWALRTLPKLQRRFVETLDRIVGFAGRGLLVPAE